MAPSEALSAPAATRAVYSPRLCPATAASCSAEGAVAERPFSGGVERHEAERVSRQLGIARRPERLGTGVEQQIGQVPAYHFAQLVDELPRRVVAPRDPHAGALRTLTREDEREHEPRMLRL